ncbi:MAG: hypothetical protein JO064_06230 [Actinobacteria bacterium]|nr:hypothetical protein [Actinomycetota bacterium]
MNVRWLATGVCAAALAAAPVAGAKNKMTLYSVATQEQYLNHQDDRTRGTGNNPFGNFKDTTTPTTESGNGPFVGDRSVISFSLYGSSDLRKSVGMATFICEYGRNKNGVCEVAYALKGGTLLGTGFFNFSASSFTIAIAGGTGQYRGATGTVFTSPGAGHSQALSFRLG